jgi:hypothetical protein
VPAAPPSPTTNYVVYPGFTGSDNGCPAGAVFVLPPNVEYQGETTFSIPLLYTGGSNFSGYSISDNADFALTFGPQRGGGPSQASIPTNITLTGQNLWACAPAARSTLMANFVAFLQEAEMKLELQGILAPGATATIAAQLADRIPAPPLETLFYRYSLAPGLSGGTAPYVDVRPGMRLRIDTESSQFISPSSPLNGYVGGAEWTVPVATTPGGSGRVVAFDPFLGVIRSPATSGAPSPLVVGGLVDLQPVAGARPHWRLLYPSSMLLPSQPGDLSMSHNVTLVGSASLANLNAVTNAYPGQAAPVTPPDVYAIVSGRAMVVPEVPITVAIGNESNIDYVPVGTTLANVVERYAPLPRDPSNPGFGLRRITSAAPDSPAPINLYQHKLAVIAPGMLDIPLIAGDTVSVTGF